MSDTIFGESSNIYRLDGERIFHDESKAWEAALGQFKQLPSWLSPDDIGDPEWMDWWTATVDIEVKPGSFDTFPKFTLAQAELKPRFDKMTKVQIIDWLTTRGFRAPVRSTRRELIVQAGLVWLGKI